MKYQEKNLRGKEKKSWYRAISLAGALAAASAPPSPLPSFSLPPRSTRPPFNAPTRQRAPVRELITPPLRRSRRSRSETLGQAASGKGGARGCARQAATATPRPRRRARKGAEGKTYTHTHAPTPLYAYTHANVSVRPAARDTPPKVHRPRPRRSPCPPRPPRLRPSRPPRAPRTPTHTCAVALWQRPVVLSVSIAFPCGEALTAAVPKHSQRAQHAARAHAYALHHLDHAAPGRSRSARPAVRGRSWTAQM